MDLIAAQVFAGCGIRRAAQKPGKALDMADIIVSRLVAELADAHVLDHATTQRADGFCRLGGGHGRLRSRGWSALTPRSSSQPPGPSPHTGTQMLPCTSPNPPLRAQRAPAAAGSFFGPKRRSRDHMISPRSVGKRTR